MLVIAGCSGPGNKMNKRVTLWRNDKIPYGAWYAYNQVESIFPKAEVVINKRSPDRYRIFSTRSAKTEEDDTKYEGKPIYHIVADGKTTGTFDIFYKVVLLNGETETLAARAKTGIICFDYSIGKKALVPEEAVIKLTQNSTTI